MSEPVLTGPTYRSNRKKPLASRYGPQTSGLPLRLSRSSTFTLSAQPTNRHAAAAAISTVSDSGCSRESAPHAADCSERRSSSQLEKPSEEIGGSLLSSRQVLSMDRTLMFLVRRALTVRNPNHTFSLRSFCSPPTLHSSHSNSKLFVGGLSWSVDEKSLIDAFSSFGEVTEVKILYDKDSGRSRGFGFVCFTNQADATCAKDAMDGKALLGRPLRISYALEKVRGAPIVVPRLSSNA